MAVKEPDTMLDKIQHPKCSRLALAAWAGRSDAVDGPATATIAAKGMANLPTPAASDSYDRASGSQWTKAVPSLLTRHPESEHASASLDDARCGVVVGRGYRDAGLGCVGSKSREVSPCVHRQIFIWAPCVLHLKLFAVQTIWWPGEWSRSNAALLA